eukprot:TRINITY_DN6185_c0_g1_i1.p1 TRINITY_DN6185_c0_g1~~TRINITY_DN6185_c0_g1_i1.p1  ORF type:complete len:315 (+),score=87.22 TRINITY_DN6185_c0_g1_i1:416-1360(+)
MRTYWTIAVIVAWVSCVALGANLRPIIGIMTQPTSEDARSGHNNQYIAASYVKYVESAGARVVPIFYNATRAELKHMFNSVNGVLFPGGGADLTNTTLYLAGKYIYDLALEANNKGDYFPIFGHCMGFEWLSMITSQDLNLLTKFDAWNIAMNLDFKPDYKSSRIFKDASYDLLNVMSTLNVTMNNHNWGVGPEAFKQNNHLAEFYHVITTNTDRQGKIFVSTIEGKKYPIYGVQWHPEKPAFEWYAQEVIPHIPEAIKVSQYMSNFFVQEARKNTHKFADATEETKRLIYNFSPVFSGAGGYGFNSFEQVYLF